LHAPASLQNQVFCTIPIVCRIEHIGVIIRLLGDIVVYEDSEFFSHQHVLPQVYQHRSSALGI
jgi:hypothetical protein